MSPDLADLRQWVGRERTVSDDLPPFPARALAAMLDHPSLPEIGAELPLGWQWLYFRDTPAQSDIGADGHPTQGGILPRAPLPRRMWGGSAIRIERPLRLGQPASRRSVLSAVEAKAGKSGALIFITLEHELTQEGQLCIREAQDLVYREMPCAAAPLAPGQRAPADADWSRTIAPDPVLLFRYSALTYNSHRIHYDRSYAMEKEFYPALVVQAPLLATLLVDLVRGELPEARIVNFQFRAVRPIFDTQPFTLCGRHEGARLLLWTADHEGNLCVTASAALA